MDMSRVTAAMTVMALTHSEQGCTPAPSVTRWALDTLVEFLGSNRETPDWSDAQWRMWLQTEVNWHVFDEPATFTAACYGLSRSQTFLAFMTDRLVRAAHTPCSAAILASAS